MGNKGNHRGETAEARLNGASRPAFHRRRAFPPEIEDRALSENMTTTGFAFEAAVLPTDVMERISSTAEPHPPKANIQTETPKPMRYPPSSKAKTHFEGSNDLGS
ncbi:hypothetical protein TGMAS_417590, partial [Toxoplasma gondii MAS]